MATAQSRDKMLTIRVTSVAGDDLTGQPVTLVQTDYQSDYGALTLGADGTCQLKVFGGNHRVTVERDGFVTAAKDFTVADDATEASVELTLEEKTRAPYALSAYSEHDAITGKNRICLSWNVEAPAFFDDFESYTPFAVQFGEWTGIDGDVEAAAPLIGLYPNRGVMQYAQIINPLTVEPTWWYDYPILRPYSGQQYVGFTRTSSGHANDDWLISPVVTVGTDNVLSFMAKAADQYPELFMVYITTKTDNPVQSDFVRLDQGNYETADHRGWKEFSYDLSAYEGEQVKFAIRCISEYNRYGSFMLMVDDVYVGGTHKAYRPHKTNGSHKTNESHKTNGFHKTYGPHETHRAHSAGSPANPNEQFRIFLDGFQVGTTDGYSFVIDDVAAGEHNVGVQAVYIQAVSAVTYVPVSVANVQYAHLVFNVSANSRLSADGQVLSIINKVSARTLELKVVDGKAEVASLPPGEYVVNIAEGAFKEYQQTITVDGDATIDIVLEDRILDPYNITADVDEDMNLTIRWNQELINSDSFESYDDFATGSFGGWTTYDFDRQPVYPIALGSQTNIVSFPGSGTATNPTAIAPMVFNPWKTTPAMLPTDPAIAAPTGDKTVIFFSPQRVQADKWLVSPLYDIREGYALTVTAKGYSSMYPESMEFCVSDGSEHPGDFIPISQVSALSAEEWTLYQTDLSDYAGQTVRLAVHYTSTDAFLAQVDDFTVGPESGEGEMVDYGNVVRFDIYLDGTKVGESEKPEYVIVDLSEGRHVIGIKAIYQSGESQLVEYVFGESDGIDASHFTLLTPHSTLHPSRYYDLLGRPTAPKSKRLYIVKRNGKTEKWIR